MREREREKKKCVRKMRETERDNLSVFLYVCERERVCVSRDL